MSESGGTLQVHTESTEGPLIAEIKLNRSNNWKITKADLLKFQPGIQHLFIVLKDGKNIMADWISFE